MKEIYIMNQTPFDSQIEEFTLILSTFNFNLTKSKSNEYPTYFYDYKRDEVNIHLSVSNEQRVWGSLSNDNSHIYFSEIVYLYELDDLYPNLLKSNDESISHYLKTLYKLLNEQCKLFDENFSSSTFFCSNALAEVLEYMLGSFMMYFGFKIRKFRSNDSIGDGIEFANEDLTILFYPPGRLDDGKITVTYFNRNIQYSISYSDLLAKLALDEENFDDALGGWRRDGFSLGNPFLLARRFKKTFPIVLEKLKNSNLILQSNNYNPR